MLNTFHKTARFRKLADWKVLVVGLSGLLLSSTAFAAGQASSVPSVLTTNFTILAEIITTVALLMGVALVLGGIFQLKRYGEMRTAMSHQMSIAAPLLMLLAGTCLLLLPVVLNTALFSFWGDNTNPLHYTGGIDGYQKFIPPIILFVRVIGIASFIRGIVLFSRAGNHSGQPGVLTKGLVHIFGGILAIHILGTVDLLQSFFGFA